MILKEVKLTQHSSKGLFWIWHQHLNFRSWILCSCI